MKRCPRCDEWLPISAFSGNRARRDGLQIYCRDCQQAYVRGHYEANRAYYIAKAARAKKKSIPELRELLRSLKAVPCADCGAVYPPHVMDFDHVRGEKLFNVGAVIGRLGPGSALREVAKCEVVCANCHRQRTHDRRLAG